MYIIMLETFADGGRPPLQTWNKPTPPQGYALCPDAFLDVFYSTTPAGFVDIEVKNNTVMAMEVNREAYDAYVAAHPVVPEPEAEAEPTSEELIDAMLGVFDE